MGYPGGIVFDGHAGNHGHWDANGHANVNHGSDQFHGGVNVDHSNNHTHTSVDGGWAHHGQHGTVDVSGNYGGGDAWGVHGTVTIPLN